MTLEVVHDGEPQPVPIENATGYYMVKTPYDVFLVDGRYYACHEGIWLTAAVPGRRWVAQERAYASPILYTSRIRQISRRMI